MGEILFGIEVRKEVLVYALLIESATSHFVARLLDIPNYPDSISFGNKATSLSFNQKISILMDIDALEKEDGKKIKTFMGIRNQFMHNINAQTYESCFNILDGSEKFLLKHYPQQSTLSKEDQLHNAVESLSKDILFKITALEEKVKAKVEQRIKAEIEKKTSQAFVDSIKELESTLNKYIQDNKLTTFPTGDGSGKKMGTIIANLMYGLVIKKIKQD